MEHEKIKIIIADDHEMIREAWKILLEKDKRFEIVGECANGSQAIEAVGNFNPDIILMDVNMHPVNGFEATKKILKQFPTAKIIGISVSNQPSYARNMMKMGARGFVTKNSSLKEMALAITTVHKGAKYICDEVRLKMK